MKKIPLESTIVGSYKFLFQNIVSIIGVLWLPVVLFAAVLGALVYGIVPHKWLTCDFTAIPDPESFVRERLPLLMAAAPVLIISGLLAGAMVRVGILRHAVGEKTTTTWVYFSLGARVWRMIAVVLLAIVICILLEIVAGIAFGILTAVFSMLPQVPVAAVSLVSLLLCIIVVVGVVYVMVRLFFFLPAVVVAENKVGVARSWNLGKGNVWRIIVVLIAVILPIELIVGMIFYATVVPTVIVEAIRQQPQGKAEAIAFLKSLWPVLPVLLGAYLVAAIAISGLVLGAVGKAYKAVTAPDEAAA